MSVASIEKAVRAAVVAAFSTKYSTAVPEIPLAIADEISHGDFSVPCFALAEYAHASPVAIAAELEKNLGLVYPIARAKAAGPYLNIWVRREVLFRTTCQEIIAKGSHYGDWPQKPKRRIMIEYLSPNTNKPLHLGHLRNGVIGSAIINLLKTRKQEVTSAMLINDRGIHICKSMLAWLRWGNQQTPQKSAMKGDHFVGRWYVRFNEEAQKDPTLNEEAQKLLQKWEAGDQATRRLWRKMNAWVYHGFRETNKKMGFAFDHTYYESQTYALGKGIVENGLKKGIFRRTSEGAIVFDLPVGEFCVDESGKPKFATLLRPDGTSLYLTQDLGTAFLKQHEHRLDESIVVTAVEQDYHFRMLAGVLGTLEPSSHTKLRHISYAMVYLPDGKMKSREGTVVDADNLIRDLQDLAKHEIDARAKKKSLSMREREERSLAIATAAIKFYLLRYRPNTDIYFDPKESISFDGFTGPYCQYAYARATGILREAKQLKMKGRASFANMESDEEITLLHALMRFPHEVKQSADEYNPSRLATALHTIAKAFNQFYAKHPVLTKAPPTTIQARLLLVHASQNVLKDGLTLLGIKALDRM